MNNNNIRRKLESLSNILFIEYKGNLLEYNNTELYHDIHRALIEEDYSKDLLQRANIYWDLFKNINYDTFIEMSKQVENETDGDCWYVSLYKLLKSGYFYDDYIYLSTNMLLEIQTIIDIKNKIIELLKSNG